MYNDVAKPNATYGFTDSVAKSGNLLFTSLLYTDASRQMAALSKQYGCGDADQYAAEATAVGAAVDLMRDPAGRSKIPLSNQEPARGHWWIASPPLRRGGDAIHQ